MTDDQASGAEPLTVLFDRAPCGYVETNIDGVISAVNQTFLEWTGYTSAQLTGLRTFASLLSPGGRIYHETHYAPMLAMQGHARQIAFDIVCADRRRLPTLVNAVTERDPTVVRIAIFDATDRRDYERELLHAKRLAETSERRALRLVNTLQQTLLPLSLPTIPGIGIAVGFRPAGDGAELGGDFYDVFRTARDTWIITLGDVQGKGVDAAVVTALMRFSIRAAAVEHDLPSEMLRVVNRALVQHDSQRTATCIVVSLRRQNATWEVVFSTAGHPLPFLRNSDLVPAVGTPGPLLGYFDDVTLRDTQLSFTSGQCLLLYTDGVSEARRDGEWFGEDRIASLLRSWKGAASDIARDLLDAVVAFQADRPRDDVAILTIVNTP